jgi:DNA-binding response OmpR family regulator
MSLTFERVPINEISSPPDAEEHRPVVLIVDDEIAIADTLAIILANNGFATIAAYGGRSALEIARVIPPDLLLSDVSMPGMTGVELAIAISQQIADCRVLLFSGQSLTVDILAEARAAGYDFPALTKPIHPSVLLRRIAHCLQEFRPAAGIADGWRNNSDESVLFPPRAELSVQ